MFTIAAAHREGHMVERTKGEQERISLVSLQEERESIKQHVSYPKLKMTLGGCWKEQQQP